MRRLIEVIIGCVLALLSVVFGLLSLVFMLPMYLFYILCDQADLIAGRCLFYSHGLIWGFNDTEGIDDDRED